jgi:hypothetical protein
MNSTHGRPRRPAGTSRFFSPPIYEPTMLATECGCPVEHIVMSSCPLVSPRNKSSRETPMSVAGTSAEEGCRQARAAAQMVLASPKTSQESRKSVPGMALEQQRAQRGAGVVRVVLRSGPRGGPRSVPRDGCRARRRRARPYIGRPPAHIVVFRTRSPHAEGLVACLYVCVIEDPRA